MTFVKSTSYCDVAFSDETPAGEFHTFMSVPKMCDYTKTFQGKVMKCRGIGILKSYNGHYYLCDINGWNEGTYKEILISTVYLNTSPKSAVIPYPVQVFGCLQWRQQPVLYANVLQIMRLPIAMMMNKLMMNTQKKHLAKLTLPDDINIHERFS